MIITHILCQFSARSLKEALEKLQAVKHKIISHEDCADYNIFTDPDHQETVFISQNWNNLEAFNAYRTSDLFVKMIKDIKPMMSAPPRVKVMEAQEVIS